MIAKQIKQFRIDKGVSQELAADFIGITQHHLSNYESGNTKPTKQIIKRIEEYYEAKIVIEVPKAVPKEIIYTDKTLIGENFGAEIREHRMELGISINKAAHEMGVHGGTYTDIENGIAHPQDKTILKIKKYYDIN